MSLQEISEIILTEFNDLATTETLEYRIDNDSRENPSTSLWARAVIDEVEYTKIAQNDTTFNYHSEGIFVVETFARPGTGSKSSIDLADIIRDTMNDSELGSGKVFLREGRIIKLGNVNGNYQVNIIFDYLGDITLT